MIRVGKSVTGKYWTVVFNGRVLDTRETKYQAEKLAKTYALAYAKMGK